MILSNTEIERQLIDLKLRVDDMEAANRKLRTRVLELESADVAEAPSGTDSVGENPVFRTVTSLFYRVRALLPEIIFQKLGGTKQTVLAEYVDGTFSISINLRKDSGGNWNLFDTSAAGFLVQFDLSTNSMIFSTATSGTNPRTLTQSLVLTKDNLTFGSTQILDAQQADVGVAATVLAITTVATAGAAYTATEQGMLNSLKTDVNNLRGVLVDFQTRHDNIRTVLRNHGLTA